MDSQVLAREKQLRELNLANIAASVTSNGRDYALYAIKGLLQGLYPDLTFEEATAFIGEVLARAIGREGNREASAYEVGFCTGQMVVQKFGQPKER